MQISKMAKERKSYFDKVRAWSYQNYIYQDVIAKKCK